MKGQVEWDRKHKHKKVEGLEVKGQVECDKCKKNKAVISIVECTVAWFYHNIFLDFCRWSCSIFFKHDTYNISLYTHAFP